MAASLSVYSPTETMKLLLGCSLAGGVFYSAYTVLENFNKSKKPDCLALS